MWRREGLEAGAGGGRVRREGALDESPASGANYRLVRNETFFSGAVRSCVKAQRGTGDVPRFQVMFELINIRCGSHNKDYRASALARTAEFPCRLPFGGGLRISRSGIWRGNRAGRGLSRFERKRRTERRRPGAAVENISITLQFQIVNALTIAFRPALRTGPVVALSFFSKSVLTVRKGLAYNPPIDAAPRFTGPARRHLKLLSHHLVHDASDLGQKTKL